MGTMMKRIWVFLREDEAATATEYAVILGLILLVILGAVGTFGETTGGTWIGIDNRLDATAFGDR